MSSRLKACMEAINYQVKSPLHGDLTILFGQLRMANDVQSLFPKVKHNIEKVIMKNTGINLSFSMIEEISPNAAVYFPQVDKNNPVLNDFLKPFIDGKQIKNLGRGKLKLTGFVDRENAKIGGAFSNLILESFITTGLFEDEEFSNEEIAAIVIHELGHVFTYFEFLGTLTATNYVLQHATRELMGTRETKRKYEIIEEVKKSLGVEIPDEEALVRADSETVIQTVIIREVIIKNYSELKSELADSTGWEMLSDQFSTRHGAGRYLVTGLDKIHRTNAFDPSIHGGFMYYAMELVKLLGFIMMTFNVVGLIFNILQLTVLNPFMTTYDRSKERLQRIKRDLVDVLKNKNISKKDKQIIIEDIKAIDDIINTYSDRKTLLEHFWASIHPIGRKQYKQVVFQQELEKLINSDLYLHSARLKTLA